MNLYPDMRICPETVRAVNEVGVERVTVFMSNNGNSPYFNLPYLNAIDVDVVGAYDTPMKLEHVTDFILKGGGRSEPSSLTLNRTLIFNTSTPHVSVAEMMTKLPGTCGDREIRFTSPPGFENLLRLLAEYLHVGVPIKRVYPNTPMLSIKFRGFTIFFEFDLLVICNSDNKRENPSKKRKYVSQYTSDGKFVKTYGSTNEAGRAVGIHHATVTRYIENGRSFEGSRWAFEGEELKEPEEGTTIRAPYKRRRSGVSQYTADGKFVRNYKSVKEALDDKEENESRSVKARYASLYRARENGRLFEGFRYGHEGEELDIPEKETLVSLPRVVVSRSTIDGRSLPKTPKAVSRYTIDGRFVRNYESLAKVGIELGISTCKVLRLTQNGLSFKGSRWALQGEELKELLGEETTSFKAVSQYTADGQLVRNYARIGDAVRAVGDESRSMQATRNALVRKIRSGELFHGFRWTFQEK